MTFIPPRSSCRSFKRLSVHNILLLRIADMRFMAYVWNGDAIMKNAKPDSAEGPRFKRSRIRQIVIWIGAVHDYRSWLSEFRNRFKLEGAYHMKEVGTIINTWDISGYVINQFSVSKSWTCASTQFGTAWVYGSNEAASEKNTCGHAAIVKLIVAERCDDLKAE